MMGFVMHASMPKKKKNNRLEKKEKKSSKLLDKYRKNDGSYDCCLGSGGKDSIFNRIF